MSNLKSVKLPIANVHISGVGQNDNLVVETSREAVEKLISETPELAPFAKQILKYTFSKHIRKRETLTEGVKEELVDNLTPILKQAYCPFINQPQLAIAELEMAIERGNEAGENSYLTFDYSIGTKGEKFVDQEGKERTYSENGLNMLSVALKTSPTAKVQLLNKLREIGTEAEIRRVSAPVSTEKKRENVM